jgi:hypothetical protein
MAKDKYESHAVVGSACKFIDLAANRVIFARESGFYNVESPLKYLESKN